MNRDNLRIYKDIEIDNVYLISSFNNGSDTSFGIVRKIDNTWQLQLPSVDFDVRLTAEDLYKIYSFIDHLDAEQSLSEPGFPNWNEAPEWAVYAAMDDDGFWYWYETLPCLNSISEEWEPAHQTRYDYIGTNPIIRSKDSLLKRGEYLET